MSTGASVLIAAIVLAFAFGLFRAATNGRFRGTHRVRGAVDPEAPSPGSVLAGTKWSDQLGERATLLQFSSSFCAPCRVTRQVLASVASTSDGIAHLEVDAEHHLELVRRLGILRTPTTLVLGPDGREITRAAGAPTRAQVVAAVSGL